MSSDVAFSNGFGNKVPVCIHTQRFDSSWFIKTVLLISCSTIVVKYESRNSCENKSTNVASNFSVSLFVSSLAFLFYKNK